MSPVILVMIIFLTICKCKRDISGKENELNFKNIEDNVLFNNVYLEKYDSATRYPIYSGNI